MCFPGPQSHVPGFVLRRPRFSLKAGNGPRRAGSQGGRAGCGERKERSFLKRCCCPGTRNQDAVLGLCRGKREFRVPTVGPGCTGRRQGLGDASFRELTFVGPRFPLRHQRGPQPMEELPIPLSSRGGKVQADNRAPGRHRRNSEARGVSQVICVRVCLQMKS